MEPDVKAVEHVRMEKAINMLGGISIVELSILGFHSEIVDDYDALISIIKRHPMNQNEIKGFLEARGHNNDEIWEKLNQDKAVEALNYMGIITFRLK